MGKNNTSAETKSSELSFEQLYLNKDYKAAAEYLLKNKQLFSSGNFHYNLGTTYSKVGDFAAARFHLEKAVQEGNINSSTLNNLNYVKTKLEVVDITNSNSVLDQTINLATSLPFTGYSFLTLILILFLLIYVKVKKIQNKWRLGILSVMAIAPVIFYLIVVTDLHPAIVLKEISIQEGPSKIFLEKGKVKAGSKIIVGDYKDGWFFVKYPESLIGWVAKDQIGLY